MMLSKTHRLLAGLIAAAVLCTGCSAAAAESPANAEKPAVSSEAAAEPKLPAAFSAEPCTGQQESKDEVQVSYYTIMEGTEDENEVTVFTSPNPGPTIYIVGGIHGDEIAGWMTPDKMKQDGVPITCGTLYILSPANQSGAAAETRYVTGSGDLNRAFPGEPSSEDRATRLAAGIFNELKSVNPDFVLDLHESKYGPDEQDGPTGGANVLIYTLEEELGDLLLEFMFANEDHEILPNDIFSPLSPAVVGTFNRTLGDELGIPVITTETWKEYNISERMSQQKQIIEFCLRYYKML